jgi:hypothetical protein
MKHRILIISFFVLIPLAAFAAYVVGCIHSERACSRSWKAHLIGIELTAARHIREGNPEKALAVLERNSLFYGKSLEIPFSAIPNRYELKYTFVPIEGIGPLQPRVMKALEQCNVYLASYPESQSRLNR